MDPKEIREIIELISRSNFASFELEREGFKLKLVKQTAACTTEPVAGTPVSISDGESAPAVVAPGPAPAAVAVKAQEDEGVVSLTSPIVGTFYRAPGPDSPVFVEVGSKVGKGNVMCIVEAMKVMNEIESEVDAEVLDILVADGQPVEYGEVLFRLRPLS